MQEIQILAEKYKFIEGQLCTTGQIDVLTFTLSKCLIDIVFIQVCLAHSVKKTLANVVLTIILRRCFNVTLSTKERCPLKSCKDNLNLSTILGVILTYNDMMF